MNNEIYDRLKNLFEKINIDCDDVFEKAEILTYSSILNELLINVETAFKNMFITSCSAKGIDYFLELLNIEKSENVQKDKENIINAFCDNSKVLSFSKMNSSLKDISKTSEKLLLKRNFYIRNIGHLDKDILSKISFYIYNFGACNYIFKLDGSGMNFENFSEFNFKWNDIDKLKLPFSIYDSLKYVKKE